MLMVASSTRPGAGGKLCPIGLTLEREMNNLAFNVKRNDSPVPVDEEHRVAACDRQNLDLILSLSARHCKAIAVAYNVQNDAFPSNRNGPLTHVFPANRLPGESSATPAAQRGQLSSGCVSRTIDSSE